MQLGVLGLLLCLLYASSPLDWKERRAVERAFDQARSATALDLPGEPEQLTPLVAGGCGWRLSKAFTFDATHSYYALPKMTQAERWERAGALASALRREDFDVRRDGGDVLATSGDDLVVYLTLDQPTRRLGVVAGPCSTSSPQLPSPPQS